MIDISEKQFSIIRQILDTFLPEREVMVFGSRTTNNTKPYSDLDIVIMGINPVDFRTLALLKDAFAESDLPFRIDVLQWCKINPEFKRVILPQLEIIKKAS
jgi:predicted nucleotidyltransferase